MSNYPALIYVISIIIIGIWFWYECSITLLNRKKSNRPLFELNDLPLIASVVIAALLPIINIGMALLCILSMLENLLLRTGKIKHDD